MLASDVNNTDFVNPTNPDSHLHVEFYRFKPVNKWQSEVKSAELGRNAVVYDEETDFVRIMRPGDQTTIIEEKVAERHKQRWPQLWMAYLMNEGRIEQQEVPGWKLEEWPHLEDKKDLLRDLKHMRFQTVDQIAGASDAQVQKMGIGGLGMREQARVDLRNRVGKELQADMDKKDAELEALRKADAEKEERLKKLEALVMAQSQKPAELVDLRPAKRKYVRKAKTEENAAT